MSRTADVVWLDGPGELVFRTETLPACGPRDVVCETLTTVVSPGTELAAYKGMPPLRPGVVYPRLQGYCNVARVVETGAAVTATQVGDRVLTLQSHRSAFVIPESDILVPLPAEIDAARAASAYLFHLGYNAALLGDVRAGSRVAVIGLGALGLTSVAMAALGGAEVTAISDQPVPCALARRLGARDAVPRRDTDALDAAFDVVVSTVNGWADWTRALRLAAQRGTIAVLGFPGRGEPAPPENPLDSRWFYMKQLSIRAVGMSPEGPDTRGFARFNERDNLRFIVDRIADRTLDAGALISGEHPARDIEVAYRALIARADDPVTFALRWAA